MKKDARIGNAVPTSIADMPHACNPTFIRAGVASFYIPKYLFKPSIGGFVIACWPKTPRNFTASRTGQLGHFQQDAAGCHYADHTCWARGSVQDSHEELGRKVGWLQFANIMGCVAATWVALFVGFERLSTAGLFQCVAALGIVYAILLGLRYAILPTTQRFPARPDSCG